MRPPTFNSPIIAAIPAPIMMPDFSELGITLTSLEPQRVTPRIRKIKVTSICSANSALIASGPGSKPFRYSSTTGIAGVIQPGTNGTPSREGRI